MIHEMYQVCNSVSHKKCSSDLCGCRGGRMRGGIEMVNGNGDGKDGRSANARHDAWAVDREIRVVGCRFRRRADRAFEGVYFERTPAACQDRTVKRPICPSSIHGSVPFLASANRRPGAAWRDIPNSKFKSQNSGPEGGPSAYADGTDAVGRLITCGVPQRPVRSLLTAHCSPPPLTAQKCL